jgi:hypothetical protein
MLETKFYSVWNNRQITGGCVWIFVFLTDVTHKILTVIAHIPWIWSLYLFVHST